MAGGVGTRLWPMSRKSAPKQFQRLIGQRTLIQQTFDRINKIIPAENIWVMTGVEYKDITREQLPEVKEAHIICEPIARNTAAATGLATLTILREDPDAVLFGLLPADHHIGKEKVFLKTVEAIFDYLERQPEYVATIGIHPTEANAGLGYIKVGDKLAVSGGKTVLAVESFHEKPDQETAESFVESGQYLWNGGYYLFNAGQMMRYFEQYAPKINSDLKDYLIEPSAERYQLIPSEPLDKAISEKLDKLAVVAADMEWSDIGNWAALHEILSEKGRQSQVATGEHIGDGSTNNLIMGGSKLVATVGLENIVVIDTDDVILVCHRDSVQDVKKVVEELERQGKNNYL